MRGFNDRRISGLLGVLAAVLLVTGCQTDDEAEVEESPTATETDAGTLTPTETAPTPTETRTTPTEATSPTDEGTAGRDSARDLLVTPQEPITVTPGTDAEFAFAGRLGEPDADVPDVVGFGWVPCETVDATESGPLLFPDDDGDGLADEMGTSDSGVARLYDVNGERYENVDDEWPVALHTREDDPPIELTMRSASPDCVTLVFFLDDDGDEEFDLEEDGTPAETYGVAEVNWEE